MAGHGPATYCSSNSAQLGRWLAPPTFDRVSLGWTQWDNVTSVTDVWLDDVAVAEERIGCAPAAP